MANTTHEKIVTKPLKIDLHIHSAASSFKDGDLVKNGTFENFGILKRKLLDNNIDAFAITDHDCFDYDLYLKIKQSEIDGTFKKVFPGIEFSVSFKSNDSESENVVHVIAIFNDESQEGLANLKKLMPLGKPDYDNESSFSEGKFRSKLQEIGLDVVLIAHQKNSINSKHLQKDDANSVGKSRFEEFVNAEYFESYEFKNQRNGMFNHLFKFENDKENDLLRFITGSDCHQWDVYPSYSKEKTEGMVFTYLKCLPTFRGLAMALTDSSRIRIDSNFFAQSSNPLSSIDIDVGDRHISAPLSPGINVIIGDNSIGKSMFLHAMTDYRCFEESSNLSTQTKNKYKEFIDAHSINVKTEIPKESIYKFDTQGEIRKRFEDGNAFTQPFIKTLYPAETDSTPYRAFVDAQFSLLYDCLSVKFDRDKNYNELPNVFLVDNPSKNNNINVPNIPTTENEKVGATAKILRELHKIETASIALKSEIIDPADLDVLSQVLTAIKPLIEKYEAISSGISLRNSLRASINVGINTFTDAQRTLMDSKQSSWSDFENNKETISSTIAYLVSNRLDGGPFSFSFDSKPIAYNRNPLGDIAFVNRFKSNIASINNDYCRGVLKSVLLDKATINTATITEAELTSIIKDKKSTPSYTGLNLLKEKIKARLDDDFSSEQAIVKNDGQDDADYSSGFNASKYFSLIANDTNSKGIYIVDQPEDDVSQPSIKNSIVPNLRTMRSNRQIILVTHNPQFVVNLDADNVLYFSDHADGFVIQSGALEYKDSGYDILKIVSDNLDGGIDSLKKRWKRYEKDIETDKD